MHHVNEPRDGWAWWERWVAGRGVRHRWSGCDRRVPCAGPNYPSRIVRHTSKATMDLVFPVRRPSGIGTHTNPAGCCVINDVERWLGVGVKRVAERPQGPGSNFGAVSASPPVVLAVVVPALVQFATSREKRRHDVLPPAQGAHFTDSVQHGTGGRRYSAVTAGVCRQMVATQATRVSALTHSVHVLVSSDRGQMLTNPARDWIKSWTNP